MKLSMVGVALVLGSFALACGGEPEEEAPPAAREVTQLTTRLDRQLPAPVAVPDGRGIGQELEAMFEERAATLTASEPLANLGANGKKCLVRRFVDETGAEVMRRERCEHDTLKIGQVTYEDENGDGKIDAVVDANVSMYDDNHDGKVDRVVEEAARLSPPVSLAEFGEGVSIVGNGRIAERIREDKDRDGRFEQESVTATTSFRRVVRQPE